MLRKLFFGIFVLALIIITFIIGKNTNGVKTTKINKQIDNVTQVSENKIVGCTRTSRLDNKPSFDRALSLIQEKYHLWEQGGESNYGSYYFFPSHLVNCIKVIDGDVRDTTEAEGYFDFNGAEIKENYFPITVDKDYSEADEIINALLLVHEITHVRQYLDGLHNKEQLSCIDKEVEAFDASYEFARFQYGEREKSIHLRIEYDPDLNPQLQIIKAISENHKIVSLTELCKGDFGENCDKAIIRNRRDSINAVVSQDDFYKKQCKLY